MNQPAKAQEPSMEEILASIRRIISDEESAKAPSPRQDPLAPSAPSVAGVPVRTPVPDARLPAAPPLPQRSVAPGLRQSEAGYEASAALSDPPASAAPTSKFGCSDAAEGMGAGGEGVVIRALDGRAAWLGERDEPAAMPRAQAQALFEQKSAPKVEQRLLSSATTAAVNQAFNSLAQTVLVQNSRTLEDLVKEMLRPMLQKWLDDNLPALVERLVRAEIERISRGKN